MQKLQCTSHAPKNGVKFKCATMDSMDNERHIGDVVEVAS